MKTQILNKFVAAGMALAAFTLTPASHADVEVLFGGGLIQSAGGLLALNASSRRVRCRNKTAPGRILVLCAEAAKRYSPQTI